MVNPGFFRDPGFFMDGITHCVRKNYFLYRIPIGLEQKCGWKETHGTGEVRKVSTVFLHSTLDQTEKSLSLSLSLSIFI